MKKIKLFSVLIGVALLAGVAGCSSKEPAQTSQAPQQSAPASLPPGHVAVPGQTYGDNSQPAAPIDTKQVADKITKLIDEKFPGEWKVSGITLSKGNYTENNKYEIANAVGSAFPGSMVSIFVGETRISSTVKDQTGNPVLSGYPTPPAVGETMKSGKVTAGAPSSMGGTSYQKVYIPLKAGDKTVAVLSISVTQ